MGKTKMIIIIAIAVVVSVALAVLCFFVLGRLKSTSDGKMYQVYCDDTVFMAENDVFEFQSGSTVELLFPTTDEGVSYTFQVVGVDSFDTSYQEGKGYVISFEMPKTYVSVYYQVDEPFDGIAISMDENPTTGFEWEYEITPSDIIKVVEDRYVTDPYEGEEPVCGLGGVHYWKFKVVGTGTVEIKFELLRGDEDLGTKTYIYECDGTSATLIEES